MKIAVSSTGRDLNSAVDQRFGRARFFIVIDTETGAFTAHDNTQNLNALQGAGIQSAKNVVDFGAKAVISGNMGPKAFSALQAAGVDMYTGAAGTVQEAVDAFKSGTLQNAGKANVKDHWM